MARHFPVVESLTAKQFADALRSGIHRVLHEQETLNQINVFPVVDGDTGTGPCTSLHQLSAPFADHRGGLASVHGGPGSVIVSVREHVDPHALISRYHRPP